MIYKLVLCGNTIHIHLEAGEPRVGDRSGKLRTRLCHVTESDDEVISLLQKPNSDDYEIHDYDDRHELCFIEGRHRSNFSIALLLTCRQVYEEAKYLPLYHNTFSFQEDWDIHAFFDKLDDSGDKDLRHQVKSVDFGDYIETVPYLCNDSDYNHIEHVKVFKSMSSRERGHVETMKWQVTGRDLDDYESFDDFLLEPTFTFTPKKFKTISMCFAWGVNSYFEALCDRLVMYPPNHLRNFRRQAEVELGGGGVGIDVLS